MDTKGFGFGRSWSLGARLRDTWKKMRKFYKCYISFKGIQDLIKQIAVIAEFFCTATSIRRYYGYPL
jgi:hypothetical protein